MISTKEGPSPICHKITRIPYIPKHGFRFWLHVQALLRTLHIVQLWLISCYREAKGVAFILGWCWSWVPIDEGSPGHASIHATELLLLTYYIGLFYELEVTISSSVKFWKRSRQCHWYRILMGHTFVVAIGLILCLSAGKVTLYVIMVFRRTTHLKRLLILSSRSF